MYDYFQNIFSPIKKIYFKNCLSYDFLNCVAIRQHCFCILPFHSFKLSFRDTHRIHYGNIRTVLEYYILLINKFLEMKPNVQRCKCCGNFFVTKTKRKTLYCDRALYKGGKTCKDIAPKAMQKYLAKNDEIIKAYDRAKNNRWLPLLQTTENGRHMVSYVFRFF